MRIDNLGYTCPICGSHMYFSQLHHVWCCGDCSLGLPIDVMWYLYLEEKQKELENEKHEVHKESSLPKKEEGNK